MKYIFPQNGKDSEASHGVAITREHSNWMGIYYLVNFYVWALLQGAFWPFLASASASKVTYYLVKCGKALQNNQANHLKCKIRIDKGRVSQIRSFLRT